MRLDRSTEGSQVSDGVAFSREFRVGGSGGFRRGCGGRGSRIGGQRGAFGWFASDRGFGFVGEFLDV
jgi:hypothetical protein